MDVKSSSLIAAVYLAAGALVIGAVYLALPGSDDRKGTLVDLGDGQAGGDSSADSRPYTRQRALSAQHAQQIRRLRLLLRQKSDIAQNKTALLEKKTKEYVVLKREVDDLLAVLLEMAPQLPNQGVGGNGQGGVAELTRIRDDLSRTRLMEATLADELEELQNELTQNKQEIDTLQRAAESEVAALVEDHQAFQEAASKAVAAGGAASVPSLMELLSNPRADVRQWAAEVLGQIGPPAKDAIPTLLEARADRDPRVQRAAAVAVASIEDNASP